MQTNLEMVTQSDLHDAHCNVTRYEKASGTLTGALWAIAYRAVVGKLTDVKHLMVSQMMYTTNVVMYVKLGGTSSRVAGPETCKAALDAKSQGNDKAK